VGHAARMEARIKQLCCLGLGGEAVIPAVLREVHELIPSHSNMFFWVENDELSNVYDENPDAAQITPLYVQEFYNRKEREVFRSFPDAMRHEYGVFGLHQTLTVDRDTFYQSDVFNLIMRPLGSHDFLRLIVRESGRARGAVQVVRTSKDPSFTTAERYALAGLQPFIAHALTAPKSLDVPLVDSGETELIVANREGKIIYLSRQARRLLMLAAHPRIGFGSKVPETALLPANVVQICRNLLGIFAGENSAGAPVYHHRNVWGGFTFRAYRLDPTDTSSSLVGITLGHQEPLPVKLTRQIGRLPLSPRQAEVCLLIASGHSHTEIAERLGISPHTAIAHSRWIYNKLEVRSRTELVNKLLSPS
jgi:DNA-binding CsgD family transcriptional regulator